MVHAAWSRPNLQRFDHRIQHGSDFLTCMATVPPTDELILIGRFQTLLRESVRFSNFEKNFRSCDSASKLTPIQRFSDPYTLPVLWNRRNCPQSSRWEKYLKEGENSKIFVSSESAWKSTRRFRNSPKLVPKFYLQNSCWSSALLKIRNHFIKLN